MPAPLVIAAIIGAAATILGPIIGELLSKQDRAEALRLIRQSRDRFGNIDVPTLQRLVAQKLPDTELSKVNTSPELLRAQQEALASLGRRAQGGLDIGDKNVLEQVRLRSSRTANQEQAQADRAAQARGNIDPGSQLALQNMSAQAAAQRSSEAGSVVAENAQKRAYQAVLDRGQMAKGMEDTEYARKANLAQARDRISAGNVEIANAANRYNAGLGQQDFANRMAKTQGMAGQDVQLANYLSGQAQRSTDIGAGVGAGLGQAAYGVGSAMSNPNRSNAQVGSKYDPETEDAIKILKAKGLL